MIHEVHGQPDKGHGRIETRRAWSTPEVDWFEARHQWPGLKSFAAVESERIESEKTTCERRYFISSLEGTNAEAIGNVVRSHWEIENKLHWSLDASFADDQSRVRKGHGAENLSRLKRIALNLLKAESTLKRGIKTKRLKAGWEHTSLLRVLQV